MSVFAADSVTPIAVLVLAWDETTPAVRALVEATQVAESTGESILVMVPQADAPDILSAEEYLPLPAPLAPALPALALIAELPATSAFPTVPAEIPAASEQVVLPTTEEIASEPAPEAGTLATTQSIAENNTLAATPLAAAQSTLIAPALAPLPAAPVWSAVRLLRLSSLSLPELANRAGQALPAPTWTGPTLGPTAPYVGTTTVPASNVGPPSLALAQPAALLPALPLVLPAPSIASFKPEPTASSPLGPAPELTSVVASQSAAYQAVAPTYEPVEPSAQAPDLEADILPMADDEQASFEVTTPDLFLADTAGPATLAPAQADWAAALASLSQPATALPDQILAPEPLASAAAGLAPVFRPAASHYPAPDLNFQIIQYARFAVPLALAEGPFQAIYAPAWPTWLAAQELRQRTGQPLVLHVASFAATEAESLETATGWIAELQRQALRRADLVLAETSALAHRLRHELELPAASVRIIAAADAEAIAQALHTAQPRPSAGLS